MRRTLARALRLRQMSEVNTPFSLIGVLPCRSPEKK
jgi:hypothetical protein